MPRRARLDASGALHHIMVRGINKGAIFVDDHDRMQFIERLGQIVYEGKCAIYAWVLMNNHVHILFKSGKLGISTVMRKLLTWYAVYFNRRHNRTGHLFENRYKSILCDTDKYLLTLIRYIHLNPIRAKIVQSVEELDHYVWSGHRAIIGKESYRWMDTDTILAQFSDIEAEYQQFVLEGITQGRIPELTGGELIRSRGGWSQVLSMKRKNLKKEFDERILGAGDFIDRIKREAEEKHLRQLKLKQSGRPITDIIREECRKGRVSPEELKQGSRRRQACKTRIIIAYRSRHELGMSGAEIARHLGVGTSSINRALTKFEISK